LITGNEDYVAKIALVIDIIGQDGACLAEFFFRIRKGYEVHSIKRLNSLLHTDRVDHLYQDPHMGNRNVAARVSG
jgi:GDPmannose 4,6-dehydratase